MKRSAPASAAVLVLAVVCIAAAALSVRSLRALADDVVYDNTNHYLPCEKLPVVSEALMVVEEHQAVVDAILSVNPGRVGLEVDTDCCPGRADILMWYGSHEDRMAIEEIINGETFFGVPCNLRNI
jgi:hypothetical protein